MLSEIGDARYEIVKILGQGGSADVYLAKHIALNELRVLKVMHQTMMMDAKRRHRFKLEAQLAANLKHPAIVHIYDVTQTDSKLQIEMEYIEGHSLRQHLDRKHRFPLSIALAIVYGVLEGLEHAHSAKLNFDQVEYDGVIHRDLKPENIMIRKNGQPVICDFGLAKLGADLLTQTQNVSGSAAYMSPERLRGELSTRSIDIFALGILFFELIRGYRPFPGTNKAQVIENILNWKIADVENELKDCDGAIMQIIRKATARVPTQRYQDASEMLDSLKPVYKLYHGELPPSAVLNNYLSRGQFTTAEFKALLPEENHLKVKILILVGILLASAAAIGFLGLGRSTRPQAPSVNAEEDPFSRIQRQLQEKKTLEARKMLPLVDSARQQEAHYLVAKAFLELEGDPANALLLINKALNFSFHPTITALRVKIYLDQDILKMAESDLEHIEPWLNKMSDENQAQYYWLLAQLHIQKNGKNPSQALKSGARGALLKYISLRSRESQGSVANEDIRTARSLLREIR